MIGMKRLAGAALAVLALTGVAKALPEEPLEKAPLIYDATDKLIGPFYSGITYIRIDGQIYRLPIGRNGLTRNQTRVYFKDDACKTRPYLFEGELGLAPTIIAFKGDIFLPDREAELVQYGSFRSFNAKPGGRCAVSSGSFMMLPLKMKRETFLGITFPVRLEASEPAQ